MVYNDIRNYEVSIWTLQDSFLSVLKGSNVENKGQIQEPQMSIKDDGTLEFSFSLPMYLYDGPNRKENPIWFNAINGNLMVNLRKIKVIFNKNTPDEGIFEFLITVVTERHEDGQLYCDVKCEGLAFHELGKIGYKISLSQDDYIEEWGNWANESYINEVEHKAREPHNNINYWCDKIFKNTNWSYSIQMDWAAYDGMMITKDVSGNLVLSSAVASNKIIPYTDLTSEEKILINEMRETQGLRRNDKIYEDEYVSSWTTNGEVLSPRQLEEKREKYRLFDESESNIYNLTQTIAETFEVFCKYVYTYDENYHIIGREVVFYNNFLNEAKGELSITYPYATNHIEREMDGTEIVTKMYVKTLDDSSTESGLATIIDTAANRSGEDYILNFDYLYSIGTISQEQYDEIPRYEAKLYDINNQIKPLESKLIGLQNELTELSAAEIIAKNSVSLDTERISAADDLLNSITDGTGIISVTSTRPDICYIVENTNKPGTYCITIRQKGIIKDSIHVYRTYNVTSGVLSNEITEYQCEVDSDGNLTGKLINMQRPDSSSSVYVIYDYEPQLYYENIKKAWINKRNKDQVELARVQKKLVEIDGTKDSNGNRLTDGTIQIIKKQIDNLLAAKEVIINDFNKMMGPALREGNWQPEDDYANYGDKHTDYLILNHSSSLNNDLVSIGWDSELFDDEQKNYYEEGVDQTKVYYPCIDLTDYMERFTDANLNPEGNETDLTVDSLDFIFQDMPNMAIENPSFFRYFPVNSQCIFTFLRRKGTIGKIIPVLMITGVDVLVADVDITTPEAMARIGYLKTSVTAEGVDYEVKEIVGTDEIKWIPSDELEYYEIVYPRIRINSMNLKYSTDELALLLNNALIPSYEGYYLLNRTDEEAGQYYSRYYLTIKPNYIFETGSIAGQYTLNYTISNTALIMYLDAIDVLKENAYPKVSYTIDPTLMNQSFTRTAYNNLSRIVHINDADLKFENIHGYISSLDLNLDMPWEDSIEIKNYKTKFEDLFSTIVAQTEEMKKNSQAIGRAASLFTSSGVLKTEVIQATLERQDLNYAFNQGTLTIDEANGIWGSSEDGVVAYRGGGIFTATEKDEAGDWIWNTGILPSGINADLITTGQLDTNLIRIYAGNDLKFQMNGDGLFAYKSWLQDKVQAGSVADTVRTGEYVNNDLKAGEYVVHNSDGLFLVAKKDTPVLNEEGTDYITLGQDVNRVAISWDGLTIRNWSNEPVFYADTKGDLVLSGTIYATDGEFSGDIHARSLTIGGNDTPADEYIGGKVNEATNGLEERVQQNTENYVHASQEEFETRFSSEVKEQIQADVAEANSELTEKVEKLTTGVEQNSENIELWASRVESAPQDYYPEYCINNSNKTPPGDEAQWQTTVPEIQNDNEYVWYRLTKVQNDGKIIPGNPICLTGNGNGINSVTIHYQRDVDGDVAPTGTWQTSIAAANAAKSPASYPYLWTRTTTTYDDLAVTYTYTVVKDGTEGSGTTYNNVTLTLYQRSSSTVGKITTDMTYDFSTGTLTNIPSNWSTNVPSGTNPIYVTTAIIASSDTIYTISANKWAEPVQMVKNGTNGSPGSAGYSSAAIFLYQRASSKPAAFTGVLTYTFSNGNLSGSLGSWSKTIPASTADNWPCYVIQAIATGTGTTAQVSNWSEPVVYVEDGKDGTNGTNGTNGYNVAILNLYTRSESTPPKPTDFTTSGVYYSFSDRNFLYIPDNWYSSLSSLNDSSMTGSIYIMSAIASSRNTYDYIPASEWSNPVLFTGPLTATVSLYKRSATKPVSGADTPTGTIIYNFYEKTITSGTQNLNGWQLDIPDNNEYPCYRIQAMALSNSNTDDINKDEWSEPVLFSKNGEDGQPGADGRSVSDIVNYYQVNNSLTAPSNSDPLSSNWIPDTNLSKLPQMSATQQYLWNFEITYDGKGQEISRSAVTLIGKWSKDGANGTNGTNGRSIVGIEEYFTATLDKTTAPSHGTYPNLSTSSVTWYTEKEFPVPDAAQVVQYVWNIEVIKFDSGNPTVNEPHISSIIPINGTSGLNSEKVYLYQRAAQTPAKPRDNLTYYFKNYQNHAAGSLSGGSLNSWSLDVQNAMAQNADDTLPVYMISARASSNDDYDIIRGTDDSLGDEWTNPVIYIKNGIDGNGVQPYTIEYGTSNSSTIKPTTWFSSMPTYDLKGLYVWTKTTINYTSGAEPTIIYDVSYSGVDGEPGKDGENGKDGAPGAAGRGITSITNWYAASSSKTNPTLNHSWSTTVPTINETEKYLWNYETISYTTGSPTTTSAHIVGVYGDTGVGIEDIKEYYALSNTLDIPDDSEFTTEVKEVQPDNRYLWNYEEITYTGGEIKKSDKHVIGVYGDPGYSQVTLRMYKCTRDDLSNIVEPSGTMKYTFSTNTLTGGNVPSGWSRSLSDVLNNPVNAGLPCYITEKEVTGNEDEVTITGAWSDAALYLKSGTDGYSSATIALYQRSNTKLTGANRPTGKVTYNFKNKTITGSFAPWKVSVAEANGTNDELASYPLYVIYAQASVQGGDEDTIDSQTEWTVPAVLVQDGKDGTIGYNQITLQLFQCAGSEPTAVSESTQLTYHFDTGVLDGIISNGWKKSLQEALDNNLNGYPCYVTEKYIASPDLEYPFDGAWSKPVLYIKNGEDGKDGDNGITYYTWIRYSKYSDGTSPTTDPTGCEYIGIGYNKTSPTSSSNKEEYTWSKFIGPQGVKGDSGYTWIKYAKEVTYSSSGSVTVPQMYDDPKDMSYIGLAFNKTTETESSLPNDYQWSLIKGSDGIRGGKTLVINIAPKITTKEGYKYMVNINDVKAATGIDVIIGDILQYETYLYPVMNIISSTAYLGERTQMEGKDGHDGVDAGPDPNKSYLKFVYYGYQTSYSYIPKNDDSMWNELDNYIAEKGANYNYFDDSAAAALGIFSPPKGYDPGKHFLWSMEVCKYTNSAHTSFTGEEDYRQTPIRDINQANIATLIIGADGITTEVVDFKDALNTARSNITQTAEEISWLVESGDSASNMKLTSEALSVIAEDIDLRANNIVQFTIDEIKVGGRNLIRDTSQSFTLNANTSSSYYISWEFTIGELTNGKQYTFSADISLAEGSAAVDNIRCLLDNGNISNTCATPITASVIDNHIQGTFTVTDTEAIRFVMYAGIPGSTSGKNFNVLNLKFEEGNKATAWTPAPEDMIADINEATNLANNNSNFLKTYMRFYGTNEAQLNNTVSGLHVGKIETEGQTIAPIEAVMNAEGAFEVYVHGTRVSSLGNEEATIGNMRIFKTTDGGYAFI